MTEETKLDKAIERFMNAYRQMERIPRLYDGETPMYPAEIHMIESIHDNPGNNATDIAILLGLSKPAVSRMTSKLEKNGYLRKYNHSDNKKEIYYQLTPKGYRAYKGHIEFHKTSNNDVYEHFKSFSDRDRNLIIGFFQDFSDYLMQYVDHMVDTN
jgi:DNA-binding MarR family transcriptional regulator